MDVAGFQVNDTLDHLQHRRLCDVVGARIVEQALQHRKPVYDPYPQRAMRASIGAAAAGIAGHSCQSRSLAEPTLLGPAIRLGNEHIGPKAAIECFHRVAQPDSPLPLQQELPLVPIDESSARKSTRRKPSPSCEN